MMYLFGMGKAAATNEEYKAVVKQKMAFFGGVAVLGLCTLAFVVAAQVGTFITLSDYMSGVYSGIGTGFVVAGTILLVRSYRLLHDEEKLKKERLKNTDERNLMIYGKALQYAGVATFVCAYIAMLIAGAYSKIVFFCFYGIVLLFTVLYLMMVVVMHKKM